MSASATLRPARSADAAAIERLLFASSLPTAGVAESLDGFIVAESDGEIVGVAGLEGGGDSALLRSVAVAPAWRSRGFGRALVTRAIEKAETRGFGALYLLTTTAEGYFPNFGFVPTTRESVPEPVRASREFQELCPASAVVMMRRCATRG